MPGCGGGRGDVEAGSRAFGCAARLVPPVRAFADVRPRQRDAVLGPERADSLEELRLREPCVRVTDRGQDLGRAGGNPVDEADRVRGLGQRGAEAERGYGQGAVARRGGGGATRADASGRGDPQQAQRGASRGTTARRVGREGDVRGRRNREAAGNGRTNRKECQNPNGGSTRTGGKKSELSQRTRPFAIRATMRCVPCSSRHTNGATSIHLPPPPVNTGKGKLSVPSLPATIQIGSATDCMLRKLPCEARLMK